MQATELSSLLLELKELKVRNLNHMGYVCLRPAVKIFLYTPRKHNNYHFVVQAIFHKQLSQFRGAAS